MLRRRIRSLVQPFLWKFYTFYSRKDRWHTYRGIKVLVKPSVFHPGFLISTHVFVDFLAHQNIKGKKVLEIGTGSGLIALFCRKQGAKVMATDINTAAIESVKESSEFNDLNIKIIHSDIFESIPPQHFDYILSNPPYFPKKPSNDREKAFFCGPEFEFFQSFFSDATQYLSSEGEIFMILSDDCDLETIEAIANTHDWTMKEAFRTKKWGEWNMIYSLSRGLQKIVK